MTQHMMGEKPGKWLGKHPPITGTPGQKLSSPLTANPLELREKLWLCRRTNNHFLLAISFSILHLAKTFLANYLFV